MELNRMLDYLEPEIRRRVRACVRVCAFTTTDELERIAKLEAKERAKAVEAMVGKMDAP